MGRKFQNLEKRLFRRLGMTVNTATVDMKNTPPISYSNTNIRTGVVDVDKRFYLAEKRKPHFLPAPQDQLRTEQGRE